MLDVLECVGTAKTRSLREVMDAVPRPKSTLLRLLGTLISKGFVQRVGPGRYAMTLKAWRLGAQALNYQDIDTLIVPVLKRAASESEESALYAVYDDGCALYVEKASSPQAVAATVAIGDRAPAHATATGRVLLAFQLQEEIERVARSAERGARKPVMARKHLMAELDAVRRNGVACVQGEWRKEVAGVAAPVVDRTGTVIAALGIFCPSHRIEGKLEHVVSIVRRLARELSLSLGARVELDSLQHKYQAKED